LIEVPHRGRAHAGVHAREDVQHLAFAGEIGERLFGEVTRDQLECRCFVADFRKVAVDVDGVTLEFRTGHGWAPCGCVRETCGRGCWYAASLADGGQGGVTLRAMIRCPSRDRAAAVCRACRPTGRHLPSRESCWRSPATALPIRH